MAARTLNQRLNLLTRHQYASAEGERRRRKVGMLLEGTCMITEDTHY